MLLGLKYTLIAAGGETQERDSWRILARLYLYLNLIPDTSIRLFIASASNLEVGEKAVQ